MTIFTIGHSTHSADELVALLAAHEIAQLGDVRTMPMSRRHPQFNRDALDARLAASEIRYRHFPGLGGLRRPRPDSTNTAWQHASFRGYADHLASAEFEASLGELLSWAATAPTVIMCAEALWWQCHRRLIADVLVARGIDVRHIIPKGGVPKGGASSTTPHEMTPFARVENGRVSYPGLLDVSPDVRDGEGL
jgi:uncharacterized protein (DUF488 family)